MQILGILSLDFEYKKSEAEASLWFVKTFRGDIFKVPTLVLFYDHPARQEF